MYITEPEDIIQNFLRGYVSELTRLDDNGDAISNRQTLVTETFDGDDLETEFTMTDNTTCFYTVKIGGVAQIPYYHFDIDYVNKKIKFKTAPETGSDNIEIKYYKGNNWIFTDKPRDNLTKLSYPRISILQVTEPHIFTGVGTTNTYLNTTFQIDCLSYKDLICQIDSENIEGDKVTRYISRNVIEAFKDNWDTQLIHVVRDWNIINNSNQPFGVEKNIFKKIIEISITFRNLD
ncbi:MAG: hypothetical protein ACOCUD_03710 [Bacillota bacterium]